ncbi:fibronectin type III-like domain-contianing protein [Streptomyces tuirus]|uniref:Fibronectin type III-like domain-containing protein n=1 Tax=Streptomyces tuirus TaxID=68278 RepID=A0A7G1NGJ4_9ACTN|nr:hypothetical protein GCM10017668_20380 [Streptomyces tuirus]
MWSTPWAWLSRGSSPSPESAEATLELPRRGFEIWGEATGSWSYVKGSYEIPVGRSITDRRTTATINV